jgi:hypothetical protein
MIVLVKAVRLKPAVELQSKIPYDDAQRMITFLLSIHPSIRPCISQRSLEVFLYYQTFTRPLHRFLSPPLVRARRHIIKVAEI